MSIHRRRLGISIASGLLMEGLHKLSPLLILYHAQKYLGLSAFGSAQFGKVFAGFFLSPAVIVIRMVG
jgi:hypothetical protein